MANFSRNPRIVTFVTICSFFPLCSHWQLHRITCCNRVLWFSKATVSIHFSRDPVASDSLPVGIRTSACIGFQCFGFPKTLDTASSLHSPHTIRYNTLYVYPFRFVQRTELDDFDLDYPRQSQSDRKISRKHSAINGIRFHVGLDSEFQCYFILT
jgi:hypothetical protein